MGEDEGEANAEGVTERNRQIERLNEYVKQMAYKTVKSPPVASERIVSLAQVRKRNIIGTYTDHKDDMEPKERTERVGRLIAKYKTITTEQLEDIIQRHRKKQAKSEHDRKRQQIIYHETLSKLQKQCGEQLLNAMVTKFAKEIAKRAISLPPPNVETEGYQRLQKSLVCNMYLALKIPHEKHNEEHSRDYTIYMKLASVLADLILQALFLAQNTDDSGVCTERDLPQKGWPENTEKDRCIKLRALRAAKKKDRRQQRCARFSGFA